MEKEAGRRRMKTIGSHFAQDLSSSSAHLLPMNCSGRCDNRVYFARQDSASLPFFMRPRHLSTTPPPPPPPHHGQGQGPGNCTALPRREPPLCCSAVVQPLPEPPLFSRPRRSVEPLNNPPSFQSNKDQSTVTQTELPKFARPQLHPTGNEWSPRMDVAESGRTYIITLQLPGVNANDIAVQLHHSSLIMMGKRGLRSESVPFQVSWPLPSYANTDSITADFFDGILQVIVPKL